jgi:hypothetical protein
VCFTEENEPGGVRGSTCDILAIIRRTSILASDVLDCGVTSQRNAQYQKFKEYSMAGSISKNVLFESRYTSVCKQCTVSKVKRIFNGTII